MTGIRAIARHGALLAAGGAAALTVSACTWQGVTSLPLPGAQGHAAGAMTLHVELANVATLESNSPVMIDDVVVGSVGAMHVDNWVADVEVNVNPGVVVPANAVATVGQTSLLGSYHLALNPPLGVPPQGQLQSGATIPLNKSATYPSTEQTLASLSIVLNEGGLGQLGEIVSNLDDALGGNEQQIRDLLTRLDTLMGTLDTQRDDIVATIDGLNRLAGTIAGQQDVVTDALAKIPPALDVLLAERPNLTTALDKLRTFSDTATSVVHDVQGDLVTNLRNLEPTLRSLADVGPQINKALGMAVAFPYGQTGLDKYIKGDYFNLEATVDLTVPRLQRELLYGTPLGNPNAVVQAAVGDPGYVPHTTDPLGVGVRPPAGQAPPGGGR